MAEDSLVAAAPITSDDNMSAADGTGILYCARYVASGLILS